MKLDARWIYYKCKDCGWMTRIVKQWADLKPSKCMGKKCNARFDKDPSKLEIMLPKEPSKKEPVIVESKKSKKKKQVEDELSISKD